MDARQNRAGRPVVVLTSRPARALPSPTERLTTAFRLHGDAVHGFAQSRVGADAAPDVVSEVFAIAWRRIDELKDPVLPWLLATARGVMANELRRRRRASALRDRLRLNHREADAEPSDEGHVIDALHALSGADQEVLVLVAWFDLASDDLAEVLGCSVSAARVRLHRARCRLRAALQAADREERSKHK